ncbi:MAG: nucleotidyltransferase domain-containing protein [Armatimonadota bacterium]|nr:nucleotidyltransferase domain-containing protein [Armatimonadota bacterium]MDR5702247.1 nucleotidyltransferase domain-containing protein [Armatimonadota bacterium]
MARAAGVSPARALEALRRLSSLGMLKVRQAGRSYLYSLDTENYLVSDVLLPALRAESRWLERLGEEVLEAARGAVESVVLYGSFARGEVRESSDIDLLVVVREDCWVDKVRERLDEERGRLERRFGRSISFLVLSIPDLRKRVQLGDRFAAEVLAQGRSW